MDGMAAVTGSIGVVIVLCPPGYRLELEDRHPSMHVVQSGWAHAQMAGVEPMNSADRTRTLTSVKAIGPGSLHVEWSNGMKVDLDLSTVLDDRAFAALRNPSEFSRAEIGDWGHSLAWPSGVELGADMLWLETLSATGHGDARAFLEWRLRHGLSLAKAAEALGVSRRMVAYYSNGERSVPKPILLACRGWEVVTGRPQAAA